MRLSRLRERFAKPKKAVNTADQPDRIAWQNLILCVIGLLVGFVYLIQHNAAGWFFLLGFSFLLIMQASPTDQDNY